MDEILISLELLFVKGLGSSTVKKLIQNYQTFINIVNQSFGEIESNFGKNVAELILKRDQKLKDLALKEYVKAIKNNVTLIPLSSNEYPLLLKEINDPPIILYTKGKLKDLTNSISVVGTRKYSQYGIYIVNNLVRELAKNGISIISGLALGIDGLSHKVTLEEDGYTVAVIGNSLDFIYPPENRKLYQEIEEKGCIISEFPFGTKPSTYTFPRRNRIIAGLSYATFVVEAPKESGSLITAKYANDYGRLVFTVPANINLNSASGNNLLIKEGAIPIVNFEDFKEYLPYLNYNQFKEDIINFSHEEMEILKIIGNEKVYIDSILERFNNNNIYEILNQLVLKGVLNEEFGFYYRI